MSVLACNLQTAGLNDQQELRKAAFKQVYGWIISPALWAQRLTRRFWCQELTKKKRGCSLELEYYWDRRSHLEEELEYYWERRPGCEEPYLVSRHGSSRSFWIYNYMMTDQFSYTWTISISSKSSVATLPPPKRLKFTPD
jgi:hypothetical protein